MKTITHKDKVKQLKEGDIISFQNSGEPEVIRSIIFDNIRGDHRAIDGDRVTINGFNWNISDVYIVSLNNR